MSIAESQLDPPSSPMAVPSVSWAASETADPGTASASSDAAERDPSPGSHGSLASGDVVSRSYSPTRPPTSAEIDAVIAAAMANAPAPAMAQSNLTADALARSMTPLMTNFLPGSVGTDGRVNLFVGNLPYRVRWQDLKDLFRKAGTVLRADVSLGPDNRSRGYGTVLMGSRDDAARAIDRFNGYTWQTRTLEVRPDRLPPEYEPQPHVHPGNHTAPPRVPTYTYHNMSVGGQAPYSLPGHLTPSNGPAWLPGQLQPSPHPMLYPHGHGPVPNRAMFARGASLTGMGPPPVPVTGTAQNHTSSYPAQRTPSPAFAGLPLPLHGQPTGGRGPPNLAASPLAGSLSAGTVPVPSEGVDGRRDSLAPFVYPTDTAGVARARSISPAVIAGLLPSADADQPLLLRSISPVSHSNDASVPVPLQNPRFTPPGAFAPFSPPPPAGNKPGNTSTDSGQAISRPGPSGGLRMSPSLSQEPPTTLPRNVMEGLAHQGPDLGPPSTLHDRVVFVSNLPLFMQWQELKDLLRPAGFILRADVATDPDGRPRGFGTALFASEEDAAKAVSIYHDREISGRRIQVHLERHSLEHHGHPSEQAPVLGFQPFSPAQNHNTPRRGQRPTHNSLESLEHVPSTSASIPVSPIASRLPWGLDTGLNGHSTPVRHPLVNGGMAPHGLAFKHPHHPGPITMPSYPHVDPGNPLSPLQSRNFPPMTPSMPGFVFNAYPETPPIHAHFLSPGLVGPFSPGLAVSSPTGFGYNPFLNLAPGAPINRFPQGGSAALGTPTTQVFPHNPIHGYPGRQTEGITQILQSGEYFPAVGSQPGDPPSPTRRLSSRNNITTGASPLNAKHRLASNAMNPAQHGSQSSQSDLPDLTSLRLNNGSAENLARPAMETRKSRSHLNLPELSNPNGGSADRTRVSLDEARPAGLGVPEGFAGERRASYGDIGSGIRRESKAAEA